MASLNTKSEECSGQEKLKTGWADLWSVLPWWKEQFQPSFQNRTPSFQREYRMDLQTETKPTGRLLIPQLLCIPDSDTLRLRCHRRHVKQQFPEHRIRLQLRIRQGSILRHR